MIRETKYMSFMLIIIFLTLQVSAFSEADYKEALNLSTKFFGANRCGPDVDSWIGHDSCHWHDGWDNGVDLKGGWHDCGDHVKFGETGGYAAAVLLHGYINFPGNYPDNYSPKNSAGGGNEIPDVLDEVKYYTDYALKMLQGNTLYYQVGSAGDDHQSCSEPNYQTKSESSGKDSRKSYKVTGGGASNIAGIHAAALAMMSIAYKEHDANYAAECLEMAKKLYAFGDIKHETVSSTGPSNPYSDTTWADDMALAAAEIYRADPEANKDYRGYAINFMREDNFLMPTYFVLDYPHVGPLVQYEMAKHLIKLSSYIDPLRTEASIYLDSMTSAGFAYFSEWGSLKYSAAAAYVALLAYDLEPDSVKFKNFAMDNIDFILGDHGNIPDDAPSGFSFLVGFGNKFPADQIHHSAAFGRAPGWFGTNSGAFGSSTTPNYDTLWGALVGGPTTKTGGYRDYRNDAYTNEVCIYYNAPLVSALAASFGGGPIPNKAPTDIKINSSSVLADKADELVGSFTVVDPNIGDTHTMTIVSGSDKFSISGKDLKTKVALSVGTEKVKVKATDQDGLFYEKEFSISVVEEVEDANIAKYAGWYAYVDSIGLGSSYDFVNDEVLVDDSIPTVTFNMGTSDADAKKYVYGALATETVESFDKATEFVIEYRTSEKFNLVLPVKAVADGGDYFYPLEKSTDWKTVTIAINNQNFTQPDWATDVAFDLSETKGFNFAPDFEGKSGKIELRQIVITGWNKDHVPVTKNVVKSANQLNVNSFNETEMNLTVPETGYYSMKVFTLNGRKVSSITMKLNEGVNTIGWLDAQYFGTNVVLFQISGMGTMKTQKLILQ